MLTVMIENHYNDDDYSEDKDDLQSRHGLEQSEGLLKIEVFFVTFQRSEQHEKETRDVPFAEEMCDGALL